MLWRGSARRSGIGSVDFDVWLHLEIKLQASVLPAGARDSPNHSTGDFCAGISGWLGCKVVRLIVDNDCPANYAVDGKTIGQKQGKGNPVISKQRRQISGVIGMLTAIWIIVRHGIGKRIVYAAAAVAPFMDMKSENPFLTGNIRLGQAADLGEDNHSRIGLIELHRTPYAGIVLTARDAGGRLRPAA